MRRRDFLVGAALGLAAPLLGGSRALAAVQGLLGRDAGLPVRVAYAPTREGIVRARDGFSAIRPEELASGDPAFVGCGARVTCHGLLVGGEPAAAPDWMALRCEGIRSLSIGLAYPAAASEGARLQHFWHYEDRGVPNVGRSCTATLPIDRRGLSLHVRVRREDRPDAAGVLLLSPGREVRARKPRRGHYLLSLSPRAGILVEVDPASDAHGAGPT